MNWHLVRLSTFIKKLGLLLMHFQKIFIFAKSKQKKETDKSITARCEVVERRVINLDCKNPNKKPLTNQEMSVSKSRPTISS